MISRSRIGLFLAFETLSDTRASDEVNLEPLEKL